MKIFPSTITVLAVLACAGITARAQSLDEAVAQTRAELKAATEEFSALTQRIADEKIPLAQKLNALESDLLAKRTEADKLGRQAENELVELNFARNSLTQRSNEVTYISGLLNEYLRAFETRIHIAEVERFKPAVDDAKAATESADVSTADRLARQLALMDASLTRLNGLLGGETFAGGALSPQGKLEQGKFTVLGPLAVFANDAGTVGGVVELIAGSPGPTVVDIGPDALPGIRGISTAGAGALKLDTTLGNARKVADSRDGFVEHFLKGGPVMWPIGAIALTGVIIALMKTVQLMRIRLATPMDVQKILNFLEKNSHAEAMKHAQSLTGPTGRLLVAAVEHADEKKEYIEEVLYEVMLDAKPRLERMIPFLALVAAAAPLFGLLGTVTGMINTFNMISVFGTGDPKTLSGGISEALITTEWGLYVAIPALIAQALLSRKVKGILGTMEQLTVSFVNGVPDKVENPFEQR
jgi:biopolymer transport protein ExbB